MRRGAADWRNKTIAPYKGVQIRQPRGRCIAPARSSPPFIVFGLYFVRPEGVCHQWREMPPGELSIGPVADERLGRATERAEAS